MVPFDRSFETTVVVVMRPRERVLRGQFIMCTTTDASKEGLLKDEQSHTISSD